MEGNENPEAYWVDQLAYQVLKVPGRHVISSAITTSGPTHLGTVEEFLFPSVISSRLQELGDQPEFIFIGDIMDALDSVPAGLPAWLEEWLGKPLTSVPDPYGCHRSFGEHFLADTVSYMDRFDVKPKVIPASDLYASGLYDDYVKLYYSKLDAVKRILENTSLRKLPEGWMDIVMPVCETCGKIATTRVTGFDGQYIYYSDDKDVGYAKGCGHSGKVPLSGHAWKMTWRLDWPTRQAFLGVTLEGAGKDHHTKGGSWDTAKAVHEELLGRKPPLSYRWGFVLLNGKKMSKSQGIGALSEIMGYIPPEVLKYFLLRVDIEKDKSIDDSGEGMLRLIDEFERDLREPMSEKRRMAVHLAQPSEGWEKPFVLLLLAYQLEGGWDGAKQRLALKSSYLRPYVERWVASQKLPDAYRISYSPRPAQGLVRKWIMGLRGDETGLEASQKLRELANASGIPVEQAFAEAYVCLLGKPMGPKLSSLVDAIGVRRLIKDLSSS